MKKIVNEIIRKMYGGNINPLQAVNEVDSAIGGITAVILREGMTIQNHKCRVSVSRKGLGRKSLEKLNEFAVLGYDFAGKRGEIHLGKGCSSKHYRGGLDNYVSGLLQKYSGN